jgi:hypothetical protein
MVRWNVEMVEVDARSHGWMVELQVQGIGSRSNFQRRRPVREGFYARRHANGASIVVELEDEGSLIGTSRKAAGLGRITGTQACERSIESEGSDIRGERESTVKGGI